MLTANSDRVVNSNLYNPNKLIAIKKKKGKTRAKLRLNNNKL